MKKFLSFLIGSALVGGAFAQGAFFEYTPYVGAFAPQPATPWTSGWTNFDPMAATYGTPTVTVTSDISANTTWTASNVYLLDDQFIYVKNGATLTIEAGTVIRGTGKATLIIERGSKIMAQGTASNPIVFTSAAPAGQRDYGDWGGVVLCGAARHNLPAGPNAIAEGGIGDANAGKGVHGGNNDDDNSGVLSYVRIEFAGISLTPASNSEVNGLSMYSVGRQTKIDHIQVSYSGDDSYEWFGGAVDCKYLVAFRGWDDDFDTDNGFRGRIQFAASIRDSRVADQSGSNGFESDNDANGTTNTPKTAPVFSNVTIIGPSWTGNPDVIHADYKRALHIRRNSSTSVYNSIFTGYTDAGLLFDSRRTVANYCTGTLNFSGNILAGNNGDFKLAANSDTLCITTGAAMATALLAISNDTLATSNEVNLVDPFGNTNANPDLRPAAGSPAATGSVFDFVSEFFSNEESSNEVAFDVYPNPATDVLNISLNGISSVQIMDITGKTVVSVANVAGNVYSLNVNDLSKGAYVVRVSSNGSVHTAKFIKN
ncbi:MAG: T9SS type A sorting domain-containing protein [Bacteroidia bacterium]|nr:T9SS type A sorting domain-containing protein [Bacteroidia bacterium]